MSRLIVKHLPKAITEDELQALFSRHGTVTDIQLKYTDKGSFRKFGFIGFQTDEAADKAVTFLHNTFINTSKICVEKCVPLGDEKKPKAWSKYAPDSTAFKKSHKNVEKCDDNEPASKEVDKNEILEILEKYKNDPMFEEFLQAHNSADKLEKLQEKLLISQSGNEGRGVHLDDNQDENKNVYLNGKLSEKPISDLDYMKMLMQKVSGSNKNTEEKRRKKMEKKPKEKVELFTLKLKDLPYTVKKKDIREFFRPNIPFSIRIPRNIHGIAFVGYKTEKGFKKALSKDKSFLKGKQILVTHYKVKNSDINNQQNDPKKSKWKHQEDALKNEEDIAESGRIFLRNLAYTTTENDVEELFSKYGPVTEVNLPIDTTTRKPKGFGVVTFMMPEHAVKAYSELDGSILHGRMMHLLPGKAKDDKLENLEESSNFKQKKTVKQKSQAGSAHNWNTLFLGHDAVAEVIADTFDIAKEVVVGPDGKGSAAVRLAIGETQIVTQTKKYLEEQGVLVDVFNTAPKSRSKTVILVKNLPAKTKSSEIREIFQRYGELGRVILPPSGVTAIVEFFEPSEARKSFTGLAYSKFKNSPLYLEWAPENSLTESKVSEDKINISEDHKKEIVHEKSNGGDITATNAKEFCEKQVEIEEDEEEPEENTTLFIKNLSFNTTDELLKKHFLGCGKIKYATIATKNDKNNPGRKLSMGYGFVQFYLKKNADKALKTLQQSVLDGKSLEIKRSERTLKNEVTPSRKPTKLRKQTGSKILVRNVPFQANKKEIFELFSTFGEIKALRLPKKMNIGSDSHRGFAFIDYVSAADAKAAFETLSQSTHLYGRRLVLEWAATEEGVDEIRKRTAEHFGTKEEIKSKKSVFDME